MRRILLSLLVATPAALTAQEAKWSKLEGAIIWGGSDIPERKPLAVGLNPDAKHCLSQGPILDEEYVVHPQSKGLCWTYVWLAPRDQDKPLPLHPDLQKIPANRKRVEIGYSNCRFVPHALALREGQDLVVKNDDKVAHNFKCTGNPQNSPGGLLLPPTGDHVIDNLKADRLPWTLECNIHPWMRGMLMVFDHPYFAVTDEHGRFAIPLVPAGDWQLIVRHSNGIWLGGAKGKSGRAIAVRGEKCDLGSIAYPPP